MTLGHDLRRAVRVLFAEPGWTFVAVATLALGIGANAALFSIVDHALLRPVGFADPDRLLAVWGIEAGTGGDRQRTSYPDFRDFQQAAPASFEGFAAYRNLNLTLTASGAEPERVPSAAASRELFPLLRVSPLAGRVFSPEEDRPGAARAVILSESLWRERWGARNDLLGQPIVLDGQPHTVVGVMPASFRFPTDARLWIAAGPQPRNEFRGVHAYHVLGRLRPDVPMDRAAAELATVAGRLAQAYPADNAGRSVRVEAMQASLIGAARPALVMLLGAVVLILVVTCANLAALLVTRAVRRAREMAVRVSLGASRGRLVQQLLAETVVVATVGALAAIAVAAWMVPLLVHMAPADVPRIGEVVFDHRIALLSLLATIATASLFGIAPAIMATRVHPAAVLRSDSGRASAGPVRQRLRQALTVGQTALAVVLLIGAGLLLRSLSALGRVEPGFRIDGVLAVEISLPESRYPTWRDQSRFYETLAERVRALPGVESAAIASGEPFDPGFGARFGIEGRPPFPQGQEPEPAMRIITPGYLATTGVRLVRGRDIVATDRLGQPGAVLVNEALAARYFPGEDAVGRHLLRSWWDPEMPQSWEIVGIVGNARTGSLENAPEDAIYFPAAQVAFSGMTVLARTSADPLSLVSGVRAAVRALDGQLPLGRVQSMEQVLASSLAARHFYATVLGLFAALALLLAALGIYGVLAYDVAQRGREIAVRVALGARRGDVASLVARRAAAVAAGGFGLGLAGAALLSRVMRGLVFEVGPLDPVTLAAVAAAIGGSALLATALPLRRALAVDPATALRGE